jgi:hypothetical protein
MARRTARSGRPAPRRGVAYKRAASSRSEPPVPNAQRPGTRASLAQGDANAADGAVVGKPQPQRPLRNFNPLDLRDANAPADPGGIVDDDFLTRGMPPNSHRGRRPRFGNAGVETQEGAPRMRSPSILFDGPARCIQPAEPVRHLQPPRPRARPRIARSNRYGVPRSPLSRAARRPSRATIARAAIRRARFR